MSDQKLVPARTVRHEIRILNSRFLATAGPAANLDEARALLAQVRREFPDATHHVPAFVIGHGNSVLTHCHDDGEPSGTAGRPALAVLQGSGLGDAAVVVTRFFGGTKLGTGGLVRAYGDAVRAVLEVLPRARKAATHTIAFSIPYAGFERIRRLVAAHHGQPLDQEFGAEIAMRICLPTDEFEAFQAALQNATNGAVSINIEATNSNTILPLD